MKKFTATLAMVITVVMLGAGFASADDIIIDVEGRNNNNNTNNNTNTATSASDANSAAASNSSSSLVSYDRRDHIVAQPGPSGNFVPPPMAMAPANCTPLYGGGLNKKQWDAMSSVGSSFKKKGGFWHGLGADRDITVPYAPAYDGKPSGDYMMFTEWDPRKDRVEFDLILSETFCEGDYGYPLGASLGRCAKKAKEEFNADCAFACYTIRTDGSASGLSYGGGVSGSAVSGGNDKVAGSASVGAVIGTSTAYFDKAYDIYFLALNQAACMKRPAPPISAQPAPAPPVFIPAPAPVVEQKPAACNPSLFLTQIGIWSDGTRYCPDPCMNNASLRFHLGNSNAGAYDCTKDEKYARQAIAEYDAAERDILNGFEPNGAKTKNLEGAKKILHAIRFNKSWLILKLHGQDAQFGYARNNNLTAVPSTYNDLIKFQ